ncbi:hypothetical protein AMECASPLE_037474 [Ameca splendens]|uniref:Uncharacterized protein n=1 Tax=Ameca splendens TaxID=208324 RepID=A0ABV0ZUW7_9TELE
MEPRSGDEPSVGASHFSLQSCDRHIVQLRGSRKQTGGLLRCAALRCVDSVKGAPGKEERKEAGGRGERRTEAPCSRKTTYL